MPATLGRGLHTRAPAPPGSAGARFGLQPAVGRGNPPASGLRLSGPRCPALTPSAHGLQGPRSCVSLRPVPFASQVVQRWRTCWTTEETQETRFDPWAGKLPWRRAWRPTPVLLPGESHGQRSLAGYSPGGHKEADMSERLQNTPVLLSLGQCLGQDLSFIHQQRLTEQSLHSQDFPRCWTRHS